MLAGHEDVMMEKKRCLFRRISAFDFLKASPETSSSPPVLDIGDDDGPGDLRTVQEEEPPT